MACKWRVDLGAGDGRPRETRRGCVVLAALLLSACVAGGSVATSTAPTSQVPSLSGQTIAPEVALIEVPAEERGRCAKDTLPTVLRVGSAADLIVGTGDFIWISDWENALLTQVDMRTMCVGTNLSIGSPLASVIDLAATDGVVWAAEYSEGNPLLRIDAATGDVVSTIPGVVAGGGGMVGSEAGLFIACCGGDSGGSDPIIRVDTVDESVSTLATLDRNTGIDIGFGALWVGSNSPNTLSRIDPETGDVTDVIPVDGIVGDVAVSADAVWVALTDTATLIRVDPTTHAITDRIDLGSAAGRPLDVAASDDGDVWIVGPALSPTLIDGNSRKPVARIRVNAHHVLVVSGRVLFTTPDGLLIVIDDI